MVGGWIHAIPADAQPEMELILPASQLHDLL